MIFKEERTIYLDIRFVKIGLKSMQEVLVDGYYGIKQI